MTAIPHFLSIFLDRIYTECKFLVSGRYRMNLRLILNLMALPTLLGSLLTLAIGLEQARAVGATNVTTSTLSQATCDLPPKQKISLSSIQHQQGITIASADSISSDAAILSFSDAESDAAAVLFGCDCSACINALRQLRNQSLFNSSNGNGHCWTSLQRRVSTQQIQEVLQTLEMREAEQAR